MEIDIEKAIDIVCIGREELLSIQGANKIVNLLRKLEAYRQMWEELYEIASEFNFFPMMDKIKQKYFQEKKVIK